jgi:hypothetical protein
VAMVMDAVRVYALPQGCPVKTGRKRWRCRCRCRAVVVIETCRVRCECVYLYREGRKRYKAPSSSTEAPMGTKPVLMPMPVTTGSCSVEYVSEGKKGGTSSIHEDGDRRHEFGFQTL